MLVEIETTESFIREHLRKMEGPNPGKVYKLLCDTFSLQPIKNRNHHRIASEVLVKIMEYHSRANLSKDIKQQVLQYIEALAILIENYEKKHFLLDRPKVTGEEILEFLMEQHDLKQSDLKKELGSQSVVSELLSGKRKLNKRQIQALSKRFHVSPSVFF